jgi:hypothetical protein
MVLGAKPRRNPERREGYWGGRWDSHRSGVLSSNKLLISRVARFAKIAHSALRMYTVMYTERSRFRGGPSLAHQTTWPRWRQVFLELGFEEGLFRRMATQRRVLRSRFLANFRIADHPGFTQPRRSGNHGSVPASVTTSLAGRHQSTGQSDWPAPRTSASFKRKHHA